MRPYFLVCLIGYPWPCALCHLRKSIGGDSQRPRVKFFQKIRGCFCQALWMSSQLGTPSAKFWAWHFSWLPLFLSLTFLDFGLKYIEGFGEIFFPPELCLVLRQHLLCKLVMKWMKCEFISGSLLPWDEERIKELKDRSEVIIMCAAQKDKR